MASQYVGIACGRCSLSREPGVLGEGGHTTSCQSATSQPRLASPLSWLLAGRALPQRPGDSLSPSGTRTPPGLIFSFQVRRRKGDGGSRSLKALETWVATAGVACHAQHVTGTPQHSDFGVSLVPLQSVRLPGPWGHLLELGRLAPALTPPRSLCWPHSGFNRWAGDTRASPRDREIRCRNPP